MWRHWSITRLQVLGFDRNTEMKGFLYLSVLAIMSSTQWQMMFPRAGVMLVNYMSRLRLARS